MTDTMEMWTVYERPIDHPEHYVARRFIAVDGVPVPTGVVRYATTLEAVREMIPWGLMCFPRSPRDDPKIVECWM